MKKLLLILLLTMILILLSILMLSCGDRGTLVVATNDNTPPFAYRDETGELVGFDIEFAKMIAASLNRELKIEIMRFDELIPSVLDKKVDMAISAIFITAERQKIVNMSKAYYEFFQVILVKRNDTSFDTITNEDQISSLNKRLAAQLNTASMTAAAIITGDNPVLGFKSVDNAVDELLNGNVDAVIIDKMTANQYIAQYSELKILPNIEFFKRYYGVALPRDNRRLLERVNNAIAMSVSSGQYTEWLKKYMGDK